ncbi:MAG: family 43 glycosylhydrolase [Limisphaerales bacterium]
MKQYYFFVPINKFPWLTSSLPPRADSFKRLARRVWTTSHHQVLIALFLAGFTISCGDGNPSQNVESRPRRSHTVTINNIEPRRDVAGEIIDAHGGCLQFFSGRFYLYGTAFGTNESSLALNCPFRVYSSPDLAQWTFEGELLKERPDGFYFRPYVVFNPNTRKYVLWYSWFPNPKEWSGRAGAAISDTPVGPFAIVNSNVQLACSNPGDGSLFVDDDGTGYYIYTAMDMGYTVRVERLMPDYLSSSGEISDVVAMGVEAPLLFRRNNLYYTLVGELCADCPAGAEAHVGISTSPLGPFSLTSNINRRPESGPDMFTQATTNKFSRQAKAPVIPAQETWVAKIPTPGGPAFIWMADLWGSARDGCIGHDLQYWSPPLKFDPDNNGILPVDNVLRWDITWSASPTRSGHPEVVSVGNFLAAPKFTQSEPAEGNNLAWSLATSPDATNRNGAFAVKLAESACQQTRYRTTILVGTLAAAYAEAGRFDDAIATAQKACKLASESGEQDLLKKNQELLELYRKHQPYHEPR